MFAVLGLLLKSVPGLGFLPVWVWRAAAYTTVIMALMAGAWMYGRAGVLGDWAEERGQRAIAEIKMRAARVEVVTRVETKYREREKIVLVAGETIIREVTKYVDKTDDAACQLRNGFVREYDASLRNEPAGPAVDSDRAAAGIDLSVATEVIARNNLTLAFARNKLAACIDFYRQQQQLKVESK